MKTGIAQKLRYPKPLDQRKPKTQEPQPVKRQGAQRPILKGGLANGKPLIELPPQANKNQIFKQLAIDTETTGSDMWHGCRPFFISTLDEEGNLKWWEWEVDPWTREVGHWLKTPNRNTVSGAGIFLPQIPAHHVKELTALIHNHHFILHNTKFDVRAIETLGLPRLNLGTCQDTLIASHALVSNESHKLKDLALRYLDINDDDQNDLYDATNEARSMARRLGFAIAKDGGHPHFPAQRSAPKEGWWVFDTWLPRAVALYMWFVEGNIDYAPWYPGGMAPIEDINDLDQLDADCSHAWWSVLRTYALRDVERTYGLWWMQLDALEQEGLSSQYEERRRLLETLYEMEHQGVTVNLKSLSALEKKLVKESSDFKERCFTIANKKVKRGRPPILTNLASSRQLEYVLFKEFKIKPGKMTKAAIDAAKRGDKDYKGQKYSTSNEVMLKLLDRTEGEHYEFVWNLLAVRARDKSVDYCEEYRLRGIPVHTGGSAVVSTSTTKRSSTPSWINLHTSINITGPDTVRFSSSAPNIQNVGKGGKRKDDPIPSLRSIFGPMPGREWFSIDYSNIEMRIFAFKSGDPQLIEAFNTGYSVHLIFAELLYEDVWNETRNTYLNSLSKNERIKLTEDQTRRGTGELFKVLYENGSYYQWVKNGNFALIYGAGEEKADTTYHRPGAYYLIRKRLPKIDEFMKEKDHEARTYGYIAVEGGYRLYVPPSEPHVAVNYYVQGTAGWCMVLALNRVHRYLKTLNERIRREGKSSGTPDYKMIMTIHDEIDFDFPLHDRNEQVIKEIGKIMASSGDAVGVPTPVEIERHAKNWSEGAKVK